MKASTFQTLIVGLLCLAIAGLSGGLYNQYQRMAELQSTNTQRLQTLDSLQHDSSALKDAQEKLQYALKDLKQMVDTGEQQANTLDPMVDQWAHEIQELRDGLAARATQADLTVLRARLEQVEQQLLDLKAQPSLPPPTPSVTKPKKTARPKPIPLSPPFSVLSVESRGGERFLAVAPHDSRSLMDVRLLHSGEQLGTWHLKVLEPNSAIFAVATQPDQTVQLP
ncbi:chemotaxis protein [Pseudomonas chlororaphis]|uniref:Methyl-accepting chemotaxis protein n=1 Tax=Pseudomonas chlororaphis TaxID=587753 RepID=A0AAX3FTE5_9PSED|nr:chemotaxis protein [Pseudomonas chlororaphis]AZC38274.1 Methyl-accepting chemotaxis protein [Pseudomonas chlororaphis subsp. piscium]AZC44823.1 Methyl-accepting chemotaxis protein [Pseudomonas chlororaphis subsp. piscium]WDG70425.1 chemotaxis protein [Pseudomonas chlororaphis]WDH31788.1 chemotaxis protein [Pseudomonas chlororaphis]WDH68951.1 chemotaxis protein [Pseudomonas chlororaphis]